ncbi:PrpF domain-containing protein [Actinomadura rugatobispora]|uniref:PrpF domain-containing protein n=1 Tax=Actinomadura rugatobispora TaxID=1994 RepID=A0ABW1A170_9ACTN|nr:PrpF domain-containing protein [Actinomadura rugatobispora]
MAKAIPAVLMRGGTSKGLFLHARDLPPPGPARDALVLDLMGSPDPMQIDGLGGTHSSTSKVVVVEPGSGGDDVCYWFAQVGVDQPIVDWSGNCGNLTSAVGPFAVDEGLVEAVEPVTRVRMRNGNTGVRILAEVPVRDGRALAEGTHRIPGIRRPGAPVVTRYVGLGPCFPASAPAQELDGEDGPVEVTILDVTHPYVFARAEDLAVDLRDASPPALNQDGALLARVERLRGEAAVALGRAASPREAARLSPIVPRIVLVAEPADGDHHIAALGVSMGKIHHALPMTGALCLAAAVRLPGTVPSGAARGVSGESVRVRHPRGVVEVLADVAPAADPPVRSVGAIRTARRLMAGSVYAVDDGPAG